ncbi:MAG TPA: T9SS type A sorting domain-containing protein [Candidatus Kapabacteria bacterium]|nr:T9SS type A sorting domain-containing protein [Candidatus Kapabacteria bacterium]
MKKNNFDRQIVFVLDKTLTVVLFCFFGIASAHAQGQWVRTNGPYGYTTKVIASANSKRIFAATLEAGIFRSIDQGATWQQINNGLNGYLPFYSLAIDSSGNVYAGTYDGHVFKSIDYGATWVQMSDWGHQYVRCIAVSPVGVIIASTEYTAEQGGNIYSSTDDGTTWVTDSTWRSWIVAYHICFDVFNKIYVGCSGGLYRSYLSSLNSSWAILDNDPSPHGLFINSQGDIYYALWDCILHSTDGGDTWRDTALHADSIYSFGSDKSGNLYAGSLSGHLFHSGNYGQTWDSVDLHGMVAPIYGITYPPKGPLMIATGGEGIPRSIDNGQTWVEGGIKTVQPTQLLADSTGTIYAVRPDNIVSKTTDQGMHWRRLTNNPLVYITKSARNTFLYSNGCIIRKPADGAMNDTSCFSGTIYQYQCYNECPTSSSSVSVYNLISSQDGPQYFYGMITGTSCYFTRPDRELYSSPATTIRRSTDDGATWKEIKSAPCYSSPLYFSCNSGGWVFDISTDSIASLSTDNGDTWNDLSGKFSYIVGTQDMGMYAIDGNGNVMYSSDHGAHWSLSLGFNAFNVKMTSLFLGPDNILLAGTDHGKVYYSRSGNSWNALSGTLPTESVGIMAVDSGGHVWASLPDGVYRWSNSITDVRETISTPQSEEMVLYPNPTSDETTVSMTSMQRGTATIFLYDMLGRCVLQTKSSSTQNGVHTNISVSTLASGIYVCRARVGDKLFASPLVVTR